MLEVGTGDSAVNERVEEVRKSGHGAANTIVEPEGQKAETIEAREIEAVVATPQPTVPKLAR